MMMVIPEMNDADGCPLGYDDGDVVQSSGCIQIIAPVCSPIGREKSVSTAKITSLNCRLPSPLAALSTVHN